MNPDDRRPSWQNRKLSTPERRTAQSVPEDQPPAQAEAPEALLESPAAQHLVEAPQEKLLAEQSDNVVAEAEAPSVAPLQTQVLTQPSEKSLQPEATVATPVSRKRAWLLVVWPFVLLALVVLAFVLESIWLPGASNETATNVCQNATTDCQSDVIERQNTLLRSIIDNFIIGGSVVLLSLGLFSFIKGMRMLRKSDE